MDDVQLAMVMEFMLDDGGYSQIVQQATTLLERNAADLVDDLMNYTEDENPRNENYFKCVVLRYTDSQFREHFGMTRSTFEVN